MATETERDILKEFIEEYRHHPCLWEMTSSLYRNKELKHNAWGQLTMILKKLDPDANLASTKKKVDNLKTSYFRELKKVQTSELLATDEKDIHHPNLWYYKLLSFLGQGKDSRRRSSEADPLQERDEGSSECADTSEAEELEIVAPKRKSIKSTQSSRKKRKPEAEINKVNIHVEPLRYPELKYQEVQEPKLKTESFYERNHQDTFLQKAKTNTFGVYVGEQLEQISSFQRTVAEKLISEVLFLAKTGNLSCDSKIETSKQNSEEPEYIMVSPTMVEVETENEKEQSETTLLKELLTEGRRKQN